MSPHTAVEKCYPGQVSSLDGQTSLTFGPSCDECLLCWLLSPCWQPASWAGRWLLVCSNAGHGHSCGQFQFDHEAFQQENWFSDGEAKKCDFLLVLVHPWCAAYRLGKVLNLALCALQPQVVDVVVCAGLDDLK